MGIVLLSKLGQPFCEHMKVFPSDPIVLAICLLTSINEDHITEMGKSGAYAVNINTPMLTLQLGLVLYSDHVF